MSKPSLPTPPGRLPPVRRQAIDLQQQELVSARFFDEAQPLPLVLEPRFAEVDLPGWIATHREYLGSQLERWGAVLFRGFAQRGQDEFQAAIAAMGIELMEYVEGATPRTRVGDRIYTSTEFPPEHAIALHNELSYVHTWPMRVMFFCLVAAEIGGETPLADVRKVYRRIAPEIRRRFEESGWLLVRNYGGGFGPGWRESFHIESREELAGYCRAAGVEHEWRGEDGLRTRHRRPAVRRHPRTGESVWFNHVAFWHLSSLDAEIREQFVSQLADGDYPYNTYYGDGAPIPEPVVEALRQAYREETVAFPWRPGDLLVLDNMLVAHGRSRFSGARRILAAMGDPSPNEPGA